MAIFFLPERGRGRSGTASVAPCAALARASALRDDRRRSRGLHPFATADARKRLQAAADAIEATSAMEVVIAVRPAASDGRGAELLGGAIASFAMLLFTLFAPPEFSLAVIAILDLIAFGVGIYTVRAFPGVRRLLEGDRKADAAVLAAARAAFVELGVHRTRERSGLLVFVALAEARIRVVVDTGVEQAGEGVLAGLVRRIEAVGHDDGLDAQAVERLVELLGELGDALSSRLPRRADDRNELGEML